MTTRFPTGAGVREPEQVPDANDHAEETPARVLLVTRDPEIGPVLEGPLRQEGYRVTLVGDGRSALERGRELTRPAVIIMDPDLPDFRGSDLLRSLRGERATRGLPLLVVTARDSEADRVVAFELGADDFVGTPFSVREVLLRVRVQLRNRPQPLPGGGALEVGILRLDRESHRAWVKDREISLSVREFMLLQTLMTRSERVLSRNVLLDLVWGTAASVGVRAVDAYVTRLRKKLGDARDYVETVSSVGYRLKRPAGERA